MRKIDWSKEYSNVFVDSFLLGIYTSSTIFAHQRFYSRLYNQKPLDRESFTDEPARLRSIELEGSLRGESGELPLLGFPGFATGIITGLAGLPIDILTTSYRALKDSRKEKALARRV